MVKTSSNTKPNKTAVSSRKRSVSSQKGLKTRLKAFFVKFRQNHPTPHRSFRRSYREDYTRSDHAPGLLNHAVTSFQLIFKHWRLFLPFIAVMMGLYIVFVGLMSEEFYQNLQSTINASEAGQLGNFAKSGILLLSTLTSGGLVTDRDEVQALLMIFLFLVVWLVTIYLLRQLYAGRHPKLRDGLYNALGPLLSTLLVVVVIFIQMIPLMLVIITYSAAVTTGFLDTPFYALVYFLFAAAMTIITVYLLSSSLMALIAVTAPGVYPLRALSAASDLMMSRRLRLILRVIFLLISGALVYAVLLMPVILLDLWLKSIWSWLAGIPIVPFFMLFTTCLLFIYAAVYLYRYYRWLLDYKEQ